MVAHPIRNCRCGKESDAQEREKSTGEGQHTDQEGREEEFILTLFKETSVGLHFLIYIGHLKFYITRKMLLISYTFSLKENSICY